MNWEDLATRMTELFVLYDFIIGVVCDLDREHERQLDLLRGRMLNEWRPRMFPAVKVHDSETDEYVGRV